MQHPDEGTIHAWLDDALPPDEAARVAAHTAACEQCAAAVAEARGLIAGASRIVSSLDVVRGGVIPTKAAGAAAAARRERSVWGRLHLTPSRAGLVAAVLIGIVLVEGRNTAVFRTRIPVVRTTDSAVPASAPASAPAPSAPVPGVKAPAAVGPAAAAAKASAPSAPTVSTGAELPSATKQAAPSERRAEAESAKRAGGVTAAQLQEMLTDRVAADAAKSAPPAALVSAAAPARRAADSGVQPRAQANAATPAVARMRAADLATGGNFEGCYDVQQAPATSLRPLPDRFALERTTTPSGVTENVVRPIESDGRRAQPLPNGEWRQVSQAAANVTWLTNGRPRLLTLRAGADGVMGRADSVVVLKTECR